MNKDARDVNEQSEKKIYVEPKLEKKEKLQNVAEGEQPPIVT